jgi:hypothetical protein
MQMTNKVRRRLLCGVVLPSASAILAGALFPDIASCIINPILLSALVASPPLVGAFFIRGIVRWINCRAGA